jgi:hypothetical protein
MPALVQELWDIVTGYLPSLSAGFAARVFNFHLLPWQQKHSNVWSAIFQNENWTSLATSQGLNPVLVGQNLHNLYDCKDIRNAKPAYIVLVTGDNSGDIRYHQQILLDSLRPHIFNKKTNEVVFKNSNITLNIDDAIRCPELISLEPKRLFSYRYKRLRSACLYWQDDHYALYDIGEEDIIGISRRAHTLKSVSLVCGLTLPHSKNSSIPHQQELQQCFLDPKCPPILPIGHYDRGRCILLGWKWKSL